jgi:hypothetical protein
MFRVRNKIELSKDQKHNSTAPHQAAVYEGRRNRRTFAASLRGTNPAVIRQDLQDLQDGQRLRRQGRLRHPDYFPS